MNLSFQILPLPTLPLTSDAKPTFSFNFCLFFYVQNSSIVSIYRTELNTM